MQIINLYQKNKSASEHARECVLTYYAQNNHDFLRKISFN